MSHLLHHLSPAAALLFILLGVPTLASAASYHVAPNGGGATCSSASPCQLNTGLDRAGNGDEVILKDGTYRSTLFTKRAGVTIRAENTHRAIVEPPNGYDSTDNAYVRTSHNNTTVRGIVFDADRRAWPVLWIRSVENVIFENNVLKNSAPVGPLMHGGEARNIIFRHNLLENAQSEGMYLGASKSDPLRLNGAGWNENWQIYGNTYRRIGLDHFHNDIDMKNNNRNMDIHHNIMEGSPKGADGCIQANGYHHKIHDNIFRNNKCNTAIVDSVGRWAGLNIANNVISNVDSRSFISYESTYNPGNGLGETNITGNILCNASDRICVKNGSCGSLPSGLSVSNNRFNAPASQCDAEVARIMNEMKSLPGVGDGFPDTTPSGPSPCSRYRSGTPAPSPYGVAWNWLSSAKELLLALTCDGGTTNLTIGKSNANVPANGTGLVYSWGKAYAYDGNSWNVNAPLSLTCNGAKVAVNDVTPSDSLPDYWCNGTLTGTLPSNASFFAAFTCIRDATKWQCGCTDTACIRTFWQLQGRDR